MVASLNQCNMRPNLISEPSTQLSSPEAPASSGTSGLAGKSAVLPLREYVTCKADRLHVDALTGDFLAALGSEVQHLKQPVEENNGLVTLTFF